MAKKFAYRLERILDIKKLKEKLALAEVNKKAQEINEVQSDIQRCRENIMNARDENSAVGNSGEPSDIRLNQFRDESIIGQELRIKNFKKEKQFLEKQKKTLENLHTMSSIEKKKYEKHKEKRSEEYKQYIKKQETKFLDEVSHIRKKSGGVV